MELARDGVVLLFYRDFERDSFFKYDRYLKRVLRPLYHLVSSSPKVSGFYVWYQLLATALRRQGYDVRVNDYALARRHPSYPVGLVGYPHLLEGWSLPNPAVLGPSLFDHPSDAPGLMRDPRYRLYLVTCEWMRSMFSRVYGARCVLWHAGMDTLEWPDTRGEPKSLDVLIYDKLRFSREVREPGLLQPILEALRRRGLRHRILRYGQYDHRTYRTLLRQSRSMIFLCEHETQGMAYQEAMASNVPVLAWDNGFWLDPRRERYEPHPVPASSVPYFGPECGERFSDVDSFHPALDTFWSRLETYQPRRFVERELSLERSARLYLDSYAQAGGDRRACA